MSISYGLNLGIMNGAADGDLYGDAMRAFQRACDAFLQPVVKGYLTNTPPGSPVDGDMYIIGSAPTGSWASYAGYVAKWSALLAAWEFYLPKNGWQFQSNSAREIYRRTGGAWEIYYQEGTWTPALAGSVTAGTQTYFTQSGYYTRIGRVATVSFRTELSAKDAATSGNMRVTGLPFAVNNSALIQAAGSTGYVGGMNLSSATFVSMTADNGTSFANIFKWTASGSANVVATEITSSTDMCGTLVYTA